MSTHARTAFLFLALAGATLCPSCLINTSSHSDVSGKYVSPDTVAQIQPGKSEAYVLALIGEPSSRIMLDDGTQIWKWQYTETRNSQGHVIFLLNSDTSTATEKTTYVEFQDGAVVRAWRD